MKTCLLKSVSIVLAFFIMIPYVWEFNNCTVNANAGKYTDLTVIDDGYYRIFNVAADKYIDVYGNSKSNGEKLHIWQRESVQSQIFKFTRNVDGSYTIEANHSGKAVSVKNNSITEWSEIVQLDNQNNTSQKWYIEREGEFTYKIRNANSNLYMSLCYGNHDNGTAIIQYRDDGTSSIKFKLLKMESNDVKSAIWSSASSEINYDSAKQSVQLIYDFTTKSYVTALPVSISKYSYVKNGYVYYTKTTVGI